MKIIPLNAVVVRQPKKTSNLLFAANKQVGPVPLFKFIEQPPINVTDQSMQAR